MDSRRKIHPAEARSCRSKRKHGTKVDALLAGDGRAVALTAYRCKACRYWHLTSNV